MCPQDSSRLYYLKNKEIDPDLVVRSNTRMDNGSENYLVDTDEILHNLILGTLEFRTDFARIQRYDSIQYAKEFLTITLGLSRRMGMTTAIMNNMIRFARDSTISSVYIGMDQRTTDRTRCELQDRLGSGFNNYFGFTSHDPVSRGRLGGSFYEGRSFDIIFVDNFRQYIYVNHGSTDILYRQFIRASQIPIFCFCG